MAKLLNLPNELLIEIIALCRMASFQSFMLTCRRIYSAGVPLIEGYERHRAWLTPDASYSARRWLKHDSTFTSISNILGTFAQQTSLDPHLAFFLVEEVHIKNTKAHHTRWMEILSDLAEHHRSVFNQLVHAQDDIKYFSKWVRLENFTIWDEMTLELLQILDTFEVTRSRSSL